MLYIFKKRGFSLIELLVAVSIIGILATLATQNYSSSRVKAHDTNIKTSASNYRQAMELYYGQYKTYFVSDKSKNPPCSAVNPGPRPLANDQYRLKGNEDSCVGLRGSSEGMMTRRNSPELSNYKPESIAGALFNVGVLSRIETFPGVKDFTTKKTVTIDTKEYPADFVLTLCDDIGQEARSEKTATNFAIYAALKKPQSSETKTSAQLCGSKDTKYGWSITSVY